MVITIFDKNTKEVMVCLDLDNGTPEGDCGFCVDNLAVKFQQTEPVFIEKNCRIYLDENKFFIRL